MTQSRTSPTSHWTALLLAGSRPGRDPFAQANGVTLKPLIPVAGEAMLLRPLRALLACPNIDRIRVLTQDVVAIAAVIPSNPLITIECSSATIASTIAEILADPATSYPILITTADHALLTCEMLVEFQDRAACSDLAIALVEKANLMSRLPQNQRTWIGFKGGSYSGANLFAIGSPRAAVAISFWANVEQDRKKGWRMLLAFGPALFIGAVLRLRTLDQSLAQIGGKLGISLTAVVMDDALAAVDVDKPSDLALVEAIIAGTA